MGQQEVLEILIKVKPEPMSGKQIADLIGQRDKIVFVAIRNLVKGHFVKEVEIPREEAMKRFRCKRRMKLYYV